MRPRPLPLLALWTLLLLLAAVPAPALTPPLIPDAQGVLPVDGAELAWRSYGQGAPLLLITGYGATMEAWPEALLADLSRDHRVVVFDNRGMAFSTLAKGAEGQAFSYAQFASDAEAVLRGLGIGHAAVLGWSMGSCIAQELALAHPDLVDKLVLYATDMESDEVIQALRTKVDTPKDGERPLSHLFPAAWLDAHPDYLQQMPAVTRPPAQDVVDRQRAAIAAWPGTRARLGEIRCPVLLVVGRQDAVTRAAKSVEMAGLLGGPAWLAEFDNAGHGLMFQAPHALARTVLEFLGADQRLP